MFSGEILHDTLRCTGFNNTSIRNMMLKLLQNAPAELDDIFLVSLYKQLTPLESKGRTIITPQGFTVCRNKVRNYFKKPEGVTCYKGFEHQ